MSVYIPKKNERLKTYVRKLIEENRFNGVVCELLIYSSRNESNFLDGQIKVLEDQILALKKKHNEEIKLPDAFDVDDMSDLEFDQVLEACKNRGKLMKSDPRYAERIAKHKRRREREKRKQKKKSLTPTKRPDPVVP